MDKLFHTQPYKTIGDILAKVVNVSVDIFGDVELRIDDRPRETHLEDEAGRRVDAVLVEAGGVRPAAAHSREVAVLDAGDLRIVHPRRRPQVFLRRNVETDFIIVDPPIQVAPYFAALNLFRAEGFRQGADGGHRLERADKRIVLVGRVVGAENLQ